MVNGVHFIHLDMYDFVKTTQTYVFQIILVIPHPALKLSLTLLELKRVKAYRVASIFVN
jgi:hypothetical protein